MSKVGNKVNLASFQNPEFDREGGILKATLWYLVNVLFFINPLFIARGVKVALLRLFGAQVGIGVVIKPGVNIKYPWKLSIGDHCWIGENVWIDNLAEVTIGPHCCLSQGAMLLTGNHNYKKTSFDLITAPIKLGHGAWVGARATVCPGVTIGEQAIVTVASVATSDVPDSVICQGNPAKAIRMRLITE